MAEEEVILKEGENPANESGGGGGGGFSRSSAPQESEKKEEENLEESVDENKLTHQLKKISKDPKFILLFALLSGIMIILLVVLIFLSSGTSLPKDILIPASESTSQTIVNDENVVNFDMHKIDSMVQKANALYLRGEREQALKAYEHIALYSESLSSYNLGVSQMQQGAYANALANFKEAIASGENRTVAAINAAVCALHLKDEEKFKYYIDLAYVNLTNEGDSKLFDYYLSLINYYKGYYPEALQMFQKTKEASYSDDAKYLSAKIYTKMGLNEKAIQSLKAQGNYETSLSLGLLYARVGDYKNARASLEQALKINKDRNQSIATLNLIDLKTGYYQDMLTRIGRFYRQNEKQTLDTYKIKVRLKKDLSDISIAQSDFKKDFMPNKKAQADLIFYFAPYQVFDATQAAKYINKANANKFLQDETDTGTLLRTSKAISSANVRLAKIISLALNNELHKANDEFKKLLSIYQEHSILHYNLALSYAQLQKYDLAYKHFSSSYHLDPKNYAAGAFAVLSGYLSKKNITRLASELNEEFALNSNQDDKIYQYISFFTNDNNAAMLPFLDEKITPSPFMHIVSAIIAKNNGLFHQSEEHINALKELLNDDILANILYFNARNSNLSIKEYATNAQIYFRNAELNYAKLAGGAVIVRDNYIKLMRVCGLLNQEREKIKQSLALGSADEIGLSWILAYMDIYAGLYEESYALYDVLINDYEIKDSQTYFLAAVSAIGANNPNAAIALLELARLEDDSNQEARVALGLLYQEVQNYEPALFQYSKIENGFMSEFFTFDLL